MINALGAHEVMSLRFFLNFFGAFGNEERGGE